MKGKCDFCGRFAVGSAMGTLRDGTVVVSDFCREHKLEAAKVVGKLIRMPTGVAL